jgi:hypothetical protein
VRDLILLVPDKNTEYACRGALGRRHSLGIRDVDFDIDVESGRDGGVRKRGVQVLKTQQQRFRHALLILDYEGCGAAVSAEELEAALDASLAEAWGTRAKAIVIKPEVDVWMWGAETHLKEVLAWKSNLGVRDWLRDRGFTFGPEGKANRPKEALEAAFRHVHLPRSSAQYETLAKRLSLAKCKDPAFMRLRASLAGWFPPATV